MLIKFQSDVGTLTMFDDVAVPLLKLMGHSGTVPSAILPEDIPGALTRLKRSVAVSAGGAVPNALDGGDNDGTEIPVSLKQRAFPLIELLERAAKRKCEVMWQ
jgi:Domain of unknown function (DUF1840)